MSTLSRFKWWCLGLLAAGVPVSVCHASYPPNTWLQVGPVLALVAAAPWLLRHWPLSDRSVGCITAFLLLHLFAARWTYSGVPYRAWGQAVAGVDIDALFGFERNMFDRLVHFAFGLLAMRPLAEGFARYGGLFRRMAVFAALSAVLAVSALYEIFEWLLAVAMDPAAAEAYNGQQGDVFDAPKDMAMATLGAGAWLALRRWRRH